MNRMMLKIERFSLYLGKKNSEIVLYWKRIIYIVCFAGLCLIDQIIGSATGSVQYGLKHYTGVIVAIVMLTAYRPRDFLKIPYFVWGCFFFTCRYYVLEWALYHSDSYMRLNTFVWNVGIYGVVVIRFFYESFVDKKRPHMRWCLFIFWLLMSVGMAVIRSDYTWIVPMLLTYVFFYQTAFKERDLNTLYVGAIDGIILGFLVVQVQAWCYRPYDSNDGRYLGMYSHSNMNGLLYTCAYFAVLARWYFLKLKKRNILLRIPYILLAGVISGICVFTGSRSSFITLAVLTVIFLFAQFLSRRRWKIIELLVDVLVLALSTGICFLPAYGLIRYVPAYVDAPIYFESDNEKEKIQKGEPMDDEKYVEFPEALGVFGRYLWFLDEEIFQEIDVWLRGLLEQFRLTLEVQAENFIDVSVEKDSEEYVVPGTDRMHSLERGEYAEENWYDIRVDIYRYFWKKLTLVGQENIEQGVWLTYGYKATHCHNIYLQFAYDFGIIIGIMFIIVTIFPFIRVLVGLFQKKSGAWYYRLFVTLGFSTILVVFGMLEIDWIYGQLPFTMFWIVQYPVYHKQPFEVQRMQEKKRRKEQALAEKKLIVEELDSVECERDSLENT